MVEHGSGKDGEPSEDVSSPRHFFSELITSSITPLNLFPFLVLVVSLISALSSTRSSADQFISSSQGQDLFLSLALILDAMRSGERELSSEGRVRRLRKKSGIRVWRLLREQRSSLPVILHSLVTRTCSAPARLSVLISHVVGVALRLKALPKGNEGPSGREIVEQEKDAILNYYSTNILGTKLAIARHSSTVFQEFVSEFVSYQVLSEKLIPQAEKMLLRSPEVALELLADLLTFCTHDISPLLPAKLLNPTLSASKSSNADTRNKSRILFRAIIGRCSDTTVQGKIANEIIALPKGGKTASPEHRTVLFSMLTDLPVSDTVSPPVVDTLPTLIAKEGNEPAFQALCSAVGHHLFHTFSSTQPMAASASQALVKELASTKIPTRRALSNAVGQAIWEVGTKGQQFSMEGEKLISAIAPALENNLKAASACPPANPAGFLEGYVALALALGPLRGMPSAEKLTFSPTMEGILATSPKPSFVLNDKVYQRLPSSEDNLWLLRSLQGIVGGSSSKINTDGVRISVGLAFIHLVFESKSSHVMREALEVLSKLTKAQPHATSRIVRLALQSWLQAQDERRAAAKPSSEEEETVTSKSRDIGRLLSSIFVADVDTPKDILENLAVDFIVLAHHPEISPEAQTSWVGLVQALGLDPATVARDAKERILIELWEAAGTPPSVSSFYVVLYCKELIREM